MVPSILIKCFPGEGVVPRSSRVKVLFKQYSNCLYELLLYISYLVLVLVFGGGGEMSPPPICNIAGGVIFFFFLITIKQRRGYSFLEEGFIYNSGA